MQITEINGDVFSAKDCVFMQCISADIACGQGIAVEFNRHFDTRNKLREYFGSMLLRWDLGDHGFSLYCTPVLNLITKRRYFDKPTETTLKNALRDAADTCKELDIHKIAMPRIACGLDRMDWQAQVKTAIMEAFSGTDVDITVYSKK